MQVHSHMDSWLAALVAGQRPAIWDIYQQSTLGGEKSDVRAVAGDSFLYRRMRQVTVIYIVPPCSTWESRFSLTSCGFVSRPQSRMLGKFTACPPPPCKHAFF